MNKLKEAWKKDNSKPKRSKLSVYISIKGLKRGAQHANRTTNGTYKQLVKDLGIGERILTEIYFSVSKNGDTLMECSRLLYEQFDALAEPIPSWGYEDRGPHRYYYDANIVNRIFKKMGLEGFDVTEIENFKGWSKQPNWEYSETIELGGANEKNLAKWVKTWAKG